MKYRPPRQTAGPELLAQQIGDIAYSRATYLAAHAEGDSPIERLLLGAVRSVVLIGGNAQFRGVQIVPRSGDLEDAVAIAEKTVGLGYMIFVQPQVQFEGWRADFLVSAMAPIGGGQYALKSLVLECDGHAFHERTKEQAARDRQRDRASQRQGMPVLRFTGSEIWNDPVGCAEEIIAFLTSWWAI